MGEVIHRRGEDWQGSHGCCAFTLNEVELVGSPAGMAGDCEAVLLADGDVTSRITRRRLTA